MSNIQKMPDEEYFAMEGLNASSLKKFAKSPAHYSAYLEDGIKKTPAMLLGSLVHALVLEGKEEWILTPNLKLSPKEDKEATIQYMKNYLGEESFNELCPGGKVTTLIRDNFILDGNFVDENTVSKIKRMKESLLNHGTAKLFLTNPKNPEAVLTAICPNTGLLLKAKFDELPDEGNVLPDLKTCKSANRRDFSFDVKKYGYDIQACHYLYVAELNGYGFKQFAFLAVENEKPHGSASFNFSDEKLHEAFHRYHLLLEDFAECKKNNDFTSCYPQELQELF